MSAATGTSTVTVTSGFVSGVTPVGAVREINLTSAGTGYTLKGTVALSLIVAPICVKINRLNGRVSLFDVSLQTLSISLLWVSMSQQFPNPIANVCNYFNEKVIITLDYLQAQLVNRSFLN